MTDMLILDETWVADASADDPGETHIYCCDPGRALCGERLTGEDLGHLDDDTAVDCVRCEVISAANVPCGARFCNLRCWWRRWRS